jgi:hypothetical protein
MKKAANMMRPMSCSTACRCRNVLGQLFLLSSELLYAAPHGVEADFVFETDKNQPSDGARVTTISFASSR